MGNLTMLYIISFRNHAKQLLGFRVAMLLVVGILSALITLSGPAQQASQSPLNPQTSGKNEEQVPKNISDGSIGSTRVRDSRGIVRLRGEVPSALNAATKLSSPTIKESLTLTLVLNRTDQQGFDRFLASVQDPQSGSFG